MPRPPADSGDMLPLVRLVREKVAGEALRRYASAHGISYSTLRRYHDPKLPKMQQSPRPHVLRDLANALDVPLSEVQRAADQSVDRRYTVASHVVSEDLTLVVAAFEHSDEARAALVALAEKYRGLLQQERKRSNGGEG